MFRTGNPALKETTFRGLPRAAVGEAMTLQGTVNKTGLSLLILLAAAVLRLEQAAGPPAASSSSALVGGLVVALVTIFKNTAAPLHDARSTPLFEGLLLGGDLQDVRDAVPGHRHQRRGR